MSEQENRNTLEHLFQPFARHDLDVIDDLMHDDYVEEYPQSDERIRGKNYPGGLPNMVDHSFELNGDRGVLEMLVEYDGNRVHICEIVELQDGKIKRASRSMQRSGERSESKGCSVGPG
jgi:hypothetical protein